MSEVEKHNADMENRGGGSSSNSGDMFSPFLAGDISYDVAVHDDAEEVVEETVVHDSSQDSLQDRGVDETASQDLPSLDLCGESLAGDGRSGQETVLGEPVRQTLKAQELYEGPAVSVSHVSSLSGCEKDEKDEVEEDEDSLQHNQAPDAIVIVETAIELVPTNFCHRKYCFERPIVTDKHAIASAWQQWQRGLDPGPYTDPLTHFKS
ncbi:unnamed protein product [Prorocentrum cordatum]|uniref:Uncharacterized protein n=1 Tax=Prorocentrum cordatum TaxID=2364126 RepID=A0ABN9QGW4_9DINO|nr:unnamed protein product [Polarella glacialis]